MWYVGLFLVLALMIIVFFIVYELRSDKCTPADILLTVCVGKYAFFGACWVILAVLACVFQPVRTVLAYIEPIALVIWFIVHLKNIPKEWKKKKIKFKESMKNMKNFFTK